MRLRTIFTIAVAVTLFCCCTPKSTDEVNGIIVFDNNKEYPVMDLKLSDIADIEFVQLKDEDSALLVAPHIGTQYIGEDFIIIGDKVPGDLSLDNAKVYMFDRQGNYIRTLCRGGRGPGEMSYPTANIMVQPDSNKIFIGCRYSGRKILTFDFDGNLLNTTTPQNTFRESAIIGNSILLHYNSTQYVMKKFDTGEVKYIDLKIPPLSIIDATTFAPIAYDTLKYERIADEFYTGTTSTLFPNLIYTKDGIYITSLRSDTIRFIDKNLNITPRIVTKNYLPDKYRGIIPLVEMDDYILFHTQSSDVYQKENPSWQHYIYIKEEKKLYKIPYTDTKNKSFNNEIGLYAYTYTTNYDKHVHFLTYDHLVKYYYDDLPDNVKSIVDTMTEDSNPIMMIIKFRPMGDNRK